MEDPHIHHPDNDTSLVRRDTFPPDLRSDSNRYLRMSGFTAILPGLLNDLNIALGRERGVPKEVAYTIRTNRDAPNLRVEESFDYGIPVKLSVFPADDESSGHSRLVVGTGIETRSVGLLVEYGTVELMFSYIASTELPDLKQFARDLFPDTEMLFYRSVPQIVERRRFPLSKKTRVRQLRRIEISENLNDMTEENLVGLSQNKYTPYLIIPKKLEQFYRMPFVSTDPIDDPVLVLGIERYPESKETFLAIRYFVYDTRSIYGGSGQSVENALSLFIELLKRSKVHRSLF